MGQLNYENRFRSQLQKREIQPAEKSWELLKNKLDAQDNSSKAKFWWAGMAASIVGGILIIGFIYKNDTTRFSPAITDSPIHSEEIQQEKSLENNSSEPVKTPLKKALAVEVNEKNSAENEVKTETQKTAISPKQMNKTGLAEVRVQEQVPEIQITDFKPGQSDALNENLINIKLSEVIAEVTEREKQGAEITETEVDLLLAKAAAEINMQRQQYNFAVGKVDPSELLESVEMDMENSFREKVFEVLKEGFVKAKTAVANRNY